MRVCSYLARIGAALAFSLVMVSPAALAAPEPARFDKLLQACVADHPYGTIKTIERVGAVDGVPVYEAVMSKKAKRVVFFGSKAEGCAVYPIGRAITGAYGNFLGDGQRLRLFLVPQTDGTCDLDTCDAAVIIRDDKKAFHAFGRIPGCTDAAASTVKLFKGADSVSVACANTGGGDMRSHRFVLLHARGKAVRVAIDAPLGYSSEAVGMEEGKTCRVGPAGAYTLGKRSAVPSVSVLEIEDDGTAGIEFTYTWDPAKQAFAKNAGTPKTGDTNTVCVLKK